MGIKMDLPANLPNARPLNYQGVCSVHGDVRGFEKKPIFVAICPRPGCFRPLKLVDGPRDENDQPTGWFIDENG